jgi:hypothetical protein
MKRKLPRQPLAGPDDLTPSSVSPPEPTPGAPRRRGKGTGIVSRTEGAAYSSGDLGTISFAYFRTPNGKPPGVK